MDLSATSAQKIGALLTQVGVSWTYDQDGDVRVRFRLNRPPWVGPVHYEFDTSKADLSMRCRFLPGTPVAQGNGTVAWHVSQDAGHEPTAVAHKVVTIYLIPKPGHVVVQVYATVVPDSPHLSPHHIVVIPSAPSVMRIEQEFPGFACVNRDDDHITANIRGATGGDELLDLIQNAAQVGLTMFEDSFGGLMIARAFD